MKKSGGRETERKPNEVIKFATMLMTEHSVIIIYTKKAVFFIQFVTGDGALYSRTIPDVRY